MQNMIVRGEGESPYAEVFGGLLDRAEDIATSTLTGTVATTINVLEVVGTGTAFKTELFPGQRVEVYGGAPALTIPLVIDFITDDTHFTACKAPYVSTSGASCVRLPRLFEVNKKRGTALWGNAVEFDLGTILGVGDGTLRLNGAALGGTSLALTRSPKIALLNPATGNYTVYTLGMATPATLTAAVGPAGTKNMQAGVYSIRACPARIATFGYNNPSPKAEVTLTGGNKIRGTFPAADTSNGQDAWMIFVTLFTLGQGINGPWYRYQPNVGTVIVEVGAGAGQIAAAGGTYDIEYNDAEVSGNDLLSFNNDAPSKAVFIGVLDGIPLWISCQGPGATSPGPFIAPAKNNNVEAAPSALYVSPSPPDTIIGFYPGVEGKLYLMCVNSLQIAMATQARDPRIPPVVIRPSWRVGFKNPDCLLFVNGFLIGMTNNGLTRSGGDADPGSEEFGFATALTELLATVTPGHCLLALDPLRNAVVLFDSGHSLNASGFWTTRCWLYGLRENRWIGDVLLTSTTTDMIVSGAAAINGQLELLIGGRTAVATTIVRTMKWDTPGGGDAVPWYLAWEFQDSGNEVHTKRIGPYFGIVGLLGAGGTAGIYGAEPGDTISVADLEAGTNSKSGAIALPASSNITQYNQIELNIDNLKQWTVRIGATWANAGGARDRIDEVNVEVDAEGAMR